jgi:hypothetical protein
MRLITPTFQQPAPTDPGPARAARRRSAGLFGALGLVVVLAACSSGSSTAQPGSHRTTTTARHSGGGNPTPTTAATPTDHGAAVRDGSTPGTTPPTAAAGHGAVHGAVALASDLPLSRAGLTCSTIDGETFVQSGNLNAEFFSLSYTRTGTTASNWALSWQLDPRHTAISGGSMDPMTVTLEPDGTSGVFEGEAIIAIAGQQPSRTSFTGTFACP